MWFPLCGLVSYDPDMHVFVAVCLFVLIGFMLSIITYFLLTLARWLQAGAELRHAEAARLQQDVPPAA